MHSNALLVCECWSVGSRRSKYFCWDEYLRRQRCHGDCLFQDLSEILCKTENKKKNKTVTNNKRQGKREREKRQSVSQSTSYCKDKWIKNKEREEGNSWEQSNTHMNTTKKQERQCWEPKRQRFKTPCTIKIKTHGSHGRQRPDWRTACWRRACAPLICSGVPSMVMIRSPPPVPVGIGWSSMMIFALVVWRICWIFVPRGPMMAPTSSFGKVTYSQKNTRRWMFAQCVGIWLTRVEVRRVGVG